jgi:Putative restriction endonuclease
MKSLGARKEPSESYCLGERKPIPDIAIEITVTSGGIDVLEIYRRIGVQEVWFWEDGVISVYCLRSTGHELVRQSELLPELDLRSLEFHSRMADQYDAVDAFIETRLFKKSETSSDRFIDRESIEQLNCPNRIRLKN